MANIKIGNIFEIDTPKGKGYLHWIYLDSITGELIRVLKGLYPERPNNISELASLDENYMVSFPLKAAFRKGIVKLVGFYPASDFKRPAFMRSKHIIRGAFLGWHIIDTKTWHRTLVKSLSPEQKKLSPWGTWNDTLLIERLVDDWALNKWV